jgi:hypothetical protein
VKTNRPVILLTIVDPTYPGALCCIPISKDDDKNGKYRNLSQRKPDLVQSIDINEYDNFLLIQNMFYIRKEFVGEPFTVNGVHTEIKDRNLQRTISQKVAKLNALMNQGKLSFVDRKEVYEIQVQHLKESK